MLARLRRLVPKRCDGMQYVGAAVVAVGIGCIVGYALGVQFGAPVAATLAGAFTFMFGLSEED